MHPEIMAAAPPRTDPKLSFAKVAASGGKENVALGAGKNQSPVAIRNPRKQSSTMAASKDVEMNRSRTGTVTNIGGSKIVDGQIIFLEPQKTSQDAIAEATSGKVRVGNELAEGLSRMSMEASASGAIHETEASVVIKHYLVDSASDGCQRIDSGSDTGTKPPSLDGKSITSGTTFALDEKESLRPDDSASVKAAEDDDAFSGRGSIVAGSRIGSEAAARAYRAQGYDIVDRRAMHIALDSPDQGIITPQSGSSGQQLLANCNSASLGGAAVDPASFGQFYKQTPDEQLLEALDTPKDRMFLLRLEQDVIQFVKDSKEPFIDLPPCNSFCRMLTHKLADYYHMTHQVDATAGSVRIYRTPFCRLPLSLSTISNPPTTGHTPPPPSLPTMKIMRRGDANGESTSKATSETGSDGKEKGLSAKEKLSREEREAAYNKARERIFGSNAVDDTLETENSNDMSRSSSVSTKDRYGLIKKSRPKQRRDDSEGFESRSTFTPYYGQTQPTWAPAPQYTPVIASQYNLPMQGSYHASAPSHGPFPPSQGSPAQMYPPQTMSLSVMQTYPVAQQPFAAPPMPQFQARSAPLTAYGSLSQPLPQQSMQPWSQGSFQGSYQQPRSPAKQQGTIPYAYGQLPQIINPADPKSQHPIPGSFNRHAFNPKTQSFVPGIGKPTPPPSSPQVVSPHVQHRSFPTHYVNGHVQQQYQHGTGSQYQNGGSMPFHMAGQPSNTSVPSSYHASPHMSSRPTIPHNMSLGLSNMSTYGMPQNVPNGQLGSQLPHVGNMSSLPPKPPPTA